MNYLVVIAGPTASGKTALSISLARHFQTEIISADSRQFYREMNIGTAKPTGEELAAVPHHFINTLSVRDPYSAGQYEADALKLLGELFKRYRMVILTGGSGLFINAVIKGHDPLPGVDMSIRKQLNEKYHLKGIDYLREELKKRDPVFYDAVDRNNPRRMLRALEICIAGNAPYSSYLKNQPAERNFIPVFIGLDPGREKLYEKINRRVEEMMGQGLLKEVEELFPHKELNALQTVGYQELFEYLCGSITLDAAVEQIRQNTRNYAKRQMTWFRKQPGICWFDPASHQAIVSFIEERIEGEEK